MAKGGIRKVLTVGLGAVGLGAAVLAIGGAWSFARLGGAWGDYAWIIVGALSIIAALWVLFGVLDAHFDDLERLRANILVSTVDIEGRLPKPHPDFLPSDEIAGVRAAVETLIGRRVHPSQRPSARLATVLASLKEGIVVITDTGLVSLVNEAARVRLGGMRVDVGTSIYAALERHVLHGAMDEARDKGGAVETNLLSVDGEAIAAAVANMDDFGGAVLRFAPPQSIQSGGRVDHAMHLHDMPTTTKVDFDTPLGALAGLVFDSETTGLDVASDRVVSVGAVAVTGGYISSGCNIDSLVNPGRPIPRVATAVHGITDEMVETARPFAGVWPELRDSFAERVVIGHNIGFDLAVLRSEAERAGLPWRTPKFLDTLRLAARLFPQWRDLNLETIAGHLGVDVQGRHTALGDALVTAEVWARLLPLLDQAGVKTLRDAKVFQDGVEYVATRQRRLGWIMEWADDGAGGA